MLPYSCKLQYAAAAAASANRARQVAVATYGRTGFEAASLAALDILTVLNHPETIEGRHLDLRIGRPHAVVAFAVDRTFDRSTNTDRHGPWHGVPVFSAWVSEPGEVRDCTTLQRLRPLIGPPG